MLNMNTVHQTLIEHSNNPLNVDNQGVVSFPNGTHSWKVPKCEIERIQTWINVGPFSRTRGELRDRIVASPSYDCPRGRAAKPHKNVTSDAQGGQHHYRRRGPRPGNGAVVLPPGPPSRTLTIESSNIFVNMSNMFVNMFYMVLAVGLLCRAFGYALYPLYPFMYLGMLWIISWLAHRRIFGLTLELYENEKMCVLRESLWDGETRSVLSKVRVTLFEESLCDGFTYGCTTVKCLVFGERKFKKYVYADIFLWMFRSLLSILSNTGLERNNERHFDRNGRDYTEVRFETQVERVMVSSISASLRRVCTGRNRHERKRYLKFFKDMADFGSETSWFASRALLHLMLWSNQNQGTKIVLPTKRKDMMKLLRYVVRTHYGNSANFRDSGTLSRLSQGHFRRWRRAWKHFCNTHGVGEWTKPAYSCDTEQFVMDELITNVFNHLTSYLLETLASDFHHQVTAHNANNPNARLRLSMDLAKNAASHALANTTHFKNDDVFDLTGRVDAATRDILRLVVQARLNQNTGLFEIPNIDSWTDCFNLLVTLGTRANQHERKSVTVFPQSHVNMHTVRVSASQFEKKFKVPLSTAVDANRVIGDTFEWYIFFFPFFSRSRFIFDSILLLQYQMLLIQVRHEGSIASDRWYASYLHSE